MSFKGAALKRLPVIFLAGLLLFFLIPISFVYAAGLGLYEQGDPAIGTAAVGQTVADDASSAYFNPSGMTALDRSQILAGSQLLVMNAAFKSDEYIPHPAVGSDGGDAGLIIPGGGFYYAQKLLKGRAAAGLALNAPAGLGMSYENGWKGRYLIQNSLMAITNINPSLAVKVTDWFHVGAGLSVYYCYLRQEMAVFNPPSVALLPLEIGPHPDGKARLVMDDWAVGYNLGFTVKPRKGTRVGFAYRSQAKFDLDGKMKLGGLMPYLADRVDERSDVKTKLILPRNISISAYQEITRKLALLFDVGWQNWSSMKKTTITTPNASVTINRDWSDTYRLGIGAHYRLFPRLKLKTGFSYDSDPSSLANRTPDMPVSQQWRWGTGLDFDIKPNMILSLNWEFVGLGAARIDKEVEPIVVDPGPGPIIGSKTIFPGREFRGDYRQYINLIGVSFIWKFGKGAENPAEKLLFN